MELDGAVPAAAVPEEDPTEWPCKRDGRPAEREEEEEAARRRRKEKDASAAEADAAVPQNRSQATGLSRKKSKASGKMRLVRSMAVCEESPPACSPGDGPHESIEEPQARVASSLSVEEEEATPTREEEASVENEKPGLDGKATKLLSRDSSQDYTDSTGIDVHEFLVNTLKSSPRDRIMLLKLEQELIDFIRDATQYKKFPQMTSYHRMLVHRVAAYFGMDHNVDQTGKAVVVNKTPGTRIPEQAFNEHFAEEAPSAEAPKRTAPKRDGDGAEQEERQQPSAPEYRLAEIRIQEPSPLSSTQKRRQMFRSHRDGSGGGGSSSGEGGGLGGSGSWQSSTETDCGGGGTPPRRWGPRPWSSTDSESSHAGPAPARRPAVVKASSFSGISAVLMRGDTHGVLANAGSDSLSSVGTSPTACPARTRHGQQQQQPQPRRSPAAAAVPSYSATVAAAASAQVFPAGPGYCLLPLESMGIPPGSILVNPQTGQPFLNPDGTPAVYNPPAVQQQARAQLSESSQLILATAHHRPQGNHHHHHMSLSHGQASSPTSAQHPYSQHVVSFSPPQQYSVDELGLHFGHVALSHHSAAGEIPESAAAPYPPPIMHQQQQQLPTGYGASPSAGPPVTPNGYGGAGSSYPAVVQPQVYALQQQQQHQQQQHQQQQHQQQHQQQQIPVFVYAPGQLGLVGQQSCRPATPTQYGGQRGQHGQHPSQTHGFQGPPPPSQQQFQGVMSVHQQSAGAQHGNEGAQLQGLLLQYPAAAMPSYQVPYQLQAASHSQHHHHHLHQQHQQQQQQPAPAPRGPSRDGGPHPGSSDEAGRAMPLFCSLASAAVPGHGGARAPAGLPQACPGTAGSSGGCAAPSSSYSAGVPLPGGCRANYTTAVCVPWTQLRY